MVISKKIFLLTTLLVLVFLHVEGQQTISLPQAISLSREKNPLLKVELFNLDIARADIVTAKLHPNPVLNNQSLQLMRPSLFPENTNFTNAKNRQIWWQLTKPFELPALRKYRIEFAEQGANLAQKNYTESERSIFYNVANTWLDAWYAKVNLDLIKKAQGNIDSLVYINQFRLKNQVITSTDVIRAQLLADQYNLQTKTASQEYRNQLQTLKFLLGTTDSLNIDANEDIVKQIPADKIDSLLSFANANRADIQAAQGNIDLTTSNIGYQKAVAKPTPELGAIYNPQNSIPYVGFYGTIEIPIFSRNQGEIQKSKVLQAQARQNLLVVQQQVKTEITTAYSSFQTQKQNLEKFRDIMDKSTQVLNSVKYAYLKGGTTIIDFLEAQRTWFDTQNMYNNALYSYRKSYIQLLYAAGLIQQLK
ncbi:MAG: TolC family protein [Bacteroidetes bacterium]|nr:TolC family protein [Bacteroidota bacterium]